ncbi:MAG: TRAP transporter small permease subunit [Bacteroidales bacterium]|nr:TRAP transporter small permease subunit [Bacteroidales bacterium]
MKNRIDKILEQVLLALMIFLVVDVLWQVLARYLSKLMVNRFEIQIPTVLYSFTDELAGFLLIWVALLGAAYATGKKQHLAIDLLSSRLSLKGKIILNKFISFLILFFATAVLLFGGTWLVYTRFYLGQVSSAMEIPIGVVYLIVPLSGLLISYYTIFDFVSASKNF